MGTSFNIHRNRDLLVGLTALLSLPLFFYGLGDTYLWQDEAQTALLGRSVLAHGLPMVGEGTQSVSAVRGTDAGIGGIYFQIAWLQAYLAAASFSIFGESSWSARAPFAMAGWLCVPLGAWALLSAGATRAAARTSALVIAASVPFIIPSRQARYYALVAVLTLLTTGTYAALSARITRARLRTTGPSISFAAAGTMLVLSFDVTAIGVLGALAGHWALTTPGKHRWSRSFWFAWGAACVILTFWLALSMTAPSRHQHAGLGSLPARFRYGAPYYLGQINAHMVPLPALLTLLALRRPTPDVGNANDASGNRRAAALYAVVALGGMAGAMLSPHRFFRYVVPVFPIVIGLLAIGLASVWSRGRWGKALSIGVVVALISSNALFVWSHVALAALARGSGVVTVRDRVNDYSVPLALFVQELRDPPRGPVAALVEHLRTHAGPDDVVVAMYGDLPLKFHTDLEIYGGETGQLPPAEIKPDWIWPRALVVYPEVRPVADWIRLELARGTYERIELDAVDRRWENREDPQEHIFSNPGPEGPPVVLYRAAE